MEAGRAFGDAQATFEAAQVIAAPLEYAVIAITLEGPVPPPAAPPAPASYAVSAEALPVFARSGAAARAPARRVGRARFRNEAVAGGARLAATGWAIGPIGEGAAAPADPGLRTFSDFQAAVSALNRAGARWQVVPIHEEVV